VIIADAFLWLHLPKTGGTTMTRLFRERALPGITVDPDDTAAKHDSVALREGRGPWRAGDRHRFITARRLGSWLLSDWHHKRRHMGLASLPLAPVRSGLFYSLRLGGVWVAADWWLQYFAVDERVTALRLEHLSEDLNRHLLPLLPPDTAPFSAAATPRENARPVREGDPGADSEGGAFDAADRERIEAVNPVWSAWEQRVYGGPPP
jgi:hypothetical protein